MTVSGAGDLGVQPPGAGGDNDVVRDSLCGILVGFIAMAVIAALFITTEFRRAIIRTTFTATPRRGQVLAAKAVVLAAIAFVTGVAAAVPAFLISQPLLRENGFAPPAYPKVSLTDGPVARAVVGTGLALALLAVLALALGAVVRSSAAAITVVIAIVVLPLIIGPFLTLDGEAWLKRITPGAGMAIQQTRERWDDAIGPWPASPFCARGSPWPWWRPPSSFVGGTRERATRALHAEWTKARTVRSSGWLLIGVTALTLGLGALVAASSGSTGALRRAASATWMRHGSRSPGCTPDRSPPSCSGCWWCRRSTPRDDAGRRWPPSLGGGPSWSPRSSSWPDRC